MLGLSKSCLRGPSHGIDAICAIIMYTLCHFIALHSEEGLATWGGDLEWLTEWRATPTQS